VARSVASDFMQSMRFHVTSAIASGGAADLDMNSSVQQGKAQAGFNNVTTPEATSESVEYREGTYIYARKFPGNPTVSDLTMQRGVTRGDSSFWKWLRVVIEGSGEYRADLQIAHYHRDRALTREYPAQGTVNLAGINLDNPARTYHVHEAFPTRHKVAGDLDSTASDISIMELDFSYEAFEIQEHAP
jgi:phage tail-like protein